MKETKNFTETDNHEGEQFLTGIKTYKHNTIENLFLSQYNWISGKSMVSSNTWILLYNDRGQQRYTVFSGGLIEDEEYFQSIIDELVNKTT